MQQVQRASATLRQWVGSARTRRFLPWIFFGLGAVLLIYVASQYASMYAEQKRLAREWERQNSVAPIQLASQPGSPAPHDGLIRLSIPKISLDAVVVEGTSRRQLAIAPGHYKDSSFPGETGNTVITAHRDTFFRHIYELQKGDSIELRRDGKQFTYEVTGKKVVDPDDMSVVRPSTDARLTLLTCYPTYYIGPAPERLVIFAKLVMNAPQTSSAQAAKTVISAAH
jgi:LPXTG-site transpeptidase (sortase) family protein